MADIEKLEHDLEVARLAVTLLERNLRYTRAVAGLLPSARLIVQREMPYHAMDPLDPSAIAQFIRARTDEELLMLPRMGQKSLVALREWAQRQGD